MISNAGILALVLLAALPRAVTAQGYSAPSGPAEPVPLQPADDLRPAWVHAAPPAPRRTGQRADGALKPCGASVPPAVQECRRDACTTNTTKRFAAETPRPRQPPGNRPNARRPVFIGDCRRQPGRRAGRVLPVGLGDAAGVPPPGPAALPGEAFEVLGRASSTHRQQVHLLRCGSKLLLVSLTPVRCGNPDRNHRSVGGRASGGIVPPGEDSRRHGRVPPRVRAISRKTRRTGGRPCLRPHAVPRRRLLACGVVLLACLLSCCTAWLPADNRQSARQSAAVAEPA